MSLTVPIRRAYPATAAVWFDTPALWGCDHTIFIEVLGQEAIDYANVSIKEVSGFVPYPMYVQVNGIFLKVTSHDTVELELQTDFLTIHNTYSLNLTTSKIEYKVRTLTTMLQVLTFFRDAFLHLGLDCTMDTGTNKLLVSGIYCKYIEINEDLATRVIQPTLRGINVYDPISEWSVIWSFTTA